MYPSDIHSAEYANGRLLGTIIRHLGKAVLVKGVVFDKASEPLRIAASRIIDGKDVSDKIDNFDLTPVPLGFVNYGRENTMVNYIARKPVRRDWRQGFRKEQVAYLFGAPHWSVKEVAKTIEGEFPSLDEAQASVKAARGSVAWSREFAVDDKDQIYHRFYGVVGKFMDGKDFILDNKFFWVEESLKAAVK